MIFGRYDFDAVGQYYVKMTIYRRHIGHPYASQSPDVVSLIFMLVANGDRGNE